MEACLNTRHHLHAAFHQSQRRADWSLWVEVSNLYISNGANPSPLFHDISEKLV